MPLNKRTGRMFESVGRTWNSLAGYLRLCVHKEGRIKGNYKIGKHHE